MKPELLGLGELSEASSETDEIVPGHVSRLLHDLLRDVVDPVPVQAEAVRAVGPVDQQLDVLSDVFGQLFKEDFGLVVCERPHFSFLSFYLKIICRHFLSNAFPRTKKIGIFILF